MNTRITDLRCEYTKNPLGIDVERPRLSWIIDSDRRSVMQHAYQVLVASSLEKLNAEDYNLWNSGRVEGDQSIQVVYEGQPLESRQRCWWKVRVWDNAGESHFSEPAWWEMGLLNPADWQARWITGSDAIRRIEVTPPATAVPAPLLRKRFNLSRKIKSARAYICGLGYYELYINGRKIGDHVLDPAFTRYDKRALYVTYDITENLTEGCNAAGIMLGNGWYNVASREEWNFHAAPWKDTPKAICQITVDYEDGTSDVIGTDTSWVSSTGPITFDNLRNGEFYDARLEKPGWTTPEYDDSDWKRVSLRRNPGGVLSAQMLPPIRVTKSIKPASFTERSPGVYVFDMGQNMAGWVQLKVKGPEGTKIRLRHAELLKDDGTLNGKDGCFVYEGEFQTDEYILKGQGEEVWEPRFHYNGFQFVEVTGLPEEPTLDTLTGRAVHTDLENGGTFKCSDELLNEIQSCALWSTVNNYHGYPTDCPHREKNGWTGDAHLSAEQVLYNFRPMTAYTKWLTDFADEQRLDGHLPGIVPTGGWGYGVGPAWDSVCVMIPWYLYQYCGDVRVLEKSYENMRQYVDFLTSAAENHIVNYGLGDWCPPVGGPGDHKCPPAVTSTGYYFADAGIVASAAEVLGKSDDAKKYADLAEEIKAAFLAKFYDPETGMVEGDNQTSMACTLFHGIYDKGQDEKLLAALLSEIERNNNHLECGILGAKYVMQVLADYDHATTGYKIATQKDFPSWGLWIERGATTLWENWDGGGSQNHHMYSDISAWFYRALAGIRLDPEKPAFKKVIIKPHPAEGLDWVDAEHHSMYGTIKSAWRKEGGEFTLNVTIPANATATVYVPGAAETVIEGGKPAAQAEGVEFVEASGNDAVFAIGSGSYSFQTKIGK